MIGTKFEQLLKNKMLFLLKRISKIFQRLYRLLLYCFIEPKFIIIILVVLQKYLFSVFFINRFISKKFSDDKVDFVNHSKEKLFFDQRDLFSNNIPSWLYIFNKFSLMNKKIDALEIGSYEGRSSNFLLKTLENMSLTCVDTFEPFHELQEKNNEKFKKVYENFKRNTMNFSSRLNIVKNTSDFFFESNKKKFNLIYVDGSHEFEYVKRDASNAFRILDKNGIMIFDDFLWHHKQPLKLSITYAILEFLNQNKLNIKILYVNYQLMIQKIH